MTQNVKLLHPKFHSLTIIMLYWITGDKCDLQIVHDKVNCENHRTYISTHVLMA